MTRRIQHKQLLADARIVAAPELAARACTDRSFELPPVLHVATALLFVGFVSVLSLAFANPEMAVPYGVFIAFIAGFFIVPGLWTSSGAVAHRARRAAEGSGGHDAYLSGAARLRQRSRAYEKGRPEGRPSPSHLRAGWPGRRC